MSQQMRLCIFRAWLRLRTFLFQGVIFMVCANYLCIYCENNECTLNQISIDAHGHCEECIQIDINDEQLATIKRETIEKFEG